MLIEHFALTPEQQTALASLARDSVNTLPVTMGFSTTDANDFAQSVLNDFNNAAAISNNSADSAALYGIYRSRNQSLTTTANDLTEQNKKTQNALTTDLETSNRQVEMNNWEYEDKMDTLFFLQVLFIALCISAISLYLRQSMILTSGVSFTIIGIVIVVACLVLFNRWFYTLRIRDKRYWNRQYLPADRDISSQINKCP